MTSATDNRTTELREKLTERGIEYETNDHMGVCETSWNGFTVMQLTPSAKLIMTVTPDHAIAAMLGGEREKALEELVRDMSAALIHDNCYRWCEAKEPCNLITDGKCQYRERMQELGIEVIDE